MSEEAMVENDPPGRLCRTVLAFIRWVCRYTMWPGLCRMIPVRISPRRPNTRICAHACVTAANGADHRTGDLLHRIAVSAVARRGQPASTSTGRKLKRSSLRGIRIEDNVVIHENGVEKHDAGFKTGVMEQLVNPSQRRSPLLVYQKAALLRYWRIPDMTRRKRFVESVRAEHLDARHHCVARGGGAPDDSQQLAFQTTASRRERQASRCLRN